MIKVNMKRLISFFLVLIVLQCVFMVGCEDKKPTSGGDNPPVGQPEEFDYMDLYTPKTVVAYEKQTGTYRASHGYTKMAEQGYNGWHYLVRSGSGYRPMTYDSQMGGWKSDGASIVEGKMFSATDAYAVRKLEIAESGKAVIYGNIKLLDESGYAELKVYINKTPIGVVALDAETPSKYFEYSKELSVGDEVFFELLSGSVSLNPVVTFENSQDLSVYHKTTFGKYYGDVFPYYDEEAEKLYNGFLWSDDCVNQGYNNALEVSENMLTYVNVPEENNYDTWQHYKQGGRLHYIYNPNNYVDHSKYPVGVRDNMIYIDKENKRFLMIGGCYREFGASPDSWKSDLVIYSSNDEFGFDWQKEGNLVFKGYQGNLPECPSLMKIGNRWYAFVSVSHKTVHQIGPLQYWTGDENVDCMDVDWLNKEVRFLDGEDLCAARPFAVKDKVYMLGWIPNKYNGVPLAPWAGYMNLPREIVQREDGSLGARLDPALSEIVNYGNIYTLNETNYSVLSGKGGYENGSLVLNGEAALKGGLKRNYVTFTVDLGSSENSGSAGYLLRQNGKEYRIAVVKKNGKTFMKITSPDDLSHKVNSVIEIGNVDVADVKIVIDGKVMEFFVNDQYALTAVTAMDGGVYDGSLFSEGGSVKFSNVKINKLIPYGDII